MPHNYHPVVVAVVGGEGQEESGCGFKLNHHKSGVGVLALSL